MPDSASPNATPPPAPKKKPYATNPDDRRYDQYHQRSDPTKFKTPTGKPPAPPLSPEAKKRISRAGKPVVVYGPNGKMTPAVKQRIVEMLAEDFAPTKVARACGVCAATFHGHYRKDPAFAQAVNDARELYVTKLRSEVYRRGVDGWKEPVFFKGNKCGSIRRYSDSLLLAHLRRYDPSYRDSSKVAVEGSLGLEHSGVIGQFDLKEISKDGRTQLRAFLAQEIERRKAAAANAPTEGSDTSALAD
jgi:hypothetical protein